MLIVANETMINLLLISMYKFWTLKSSNTDPAGSRNFKAQVDNDFPTRKGTCSNRSVARLVYVYWGLLPSRQFFVRRLRFREVELYIISFCAILFDARFKSLLLGAMSNSRMTCHNEAGKLRQVYFLSTESSSVGARDA